ncbi:unnamed protein product [Danaus chrysippus]|uniref:non-specific protein-tyrosine kinase n=1 Tax=Danaus chrysippus TaxID=151541 RepID=A0A8J2QBI8_9NEOP|nr:unnamed protein product [Danaus chrysippus]
MDNSANDQEDLIAFLEEADLEQYYGCFRDILKVTKLSQLKFVAVEDLIQIGLSKPEQRRYKKLYSRYFPNTYITKLKRLISGHRKADLMKQEQINVTLDVQTSDMNVKVPTKHIISIEDITINKELGMGQFGVVQQGTWNTGNQRLQVAIKCLGNEKMTSNSTEFLKEAAVMHSIEHPNIVRLYGVVLHLDSLMLVTELAPLRSLLECLREVTLRIDFSVAVLCEFAEQICDGMTYLEKKRLIHRDLAARNILVFCKDRVKISDFGLSRALGVGKDYYQTNYNVNLKLPVAWCAPECILYLRFTSASDVWAFAVCLWEMFTYGFQPWAAFSGQQILEAIDAPNFQRLERPDCCPDSYYSLMLECWSHDPNDRPKFKDLAIKLRGIRPEEVQAISTYKKHEDGRRSNFLEYKTGQKITVIGKQNYTKSAMWYGVLPGGACGLFDPNQTKPYVKPERSLPGSLSHPTRNSTRNIRSSLLRSDLKRHTYSGKRTIQRSMISSPQGDVKHTSHFGLDGAYFGDISFLDSAGIPPRQVVTPYKPSEDLEQMPLINPHSPSHFSAFPLLDSPKQDNDANPDGKFKGMIRPLKTINEPTTSKSFIYKVKSATLGRSNKSDEGDNNDEVHEYHEISDTDTESIAAENKGEGGPESPGIVVKSYADFSKSLLEEMETIFRSLEHKRGDEPILETRIRIRIVRIKDSDVEAALRLHNLNQLEKRKGNSGTMKPMSAHDEKTLNTAVAMANEITTKSMNDLGGVTKPLNSPSSKFHFRFPLVTSLNTHSIHHESPKENGVQHRNFTEQARSVPDIQASLTEESRQAYVSLIEQPVPSRAMRAQLSREMPSTSGLHYTPPPPPPPPSITPHVTLPKIEHELGNSSQDSDSSDDDDDSESGNVIPLPPRGTKPKLVDKPRHVRKYPLRLPNEPAPSVVQERPAAAIYQNTITCAIHGVQIVDGPVAGPSGVDVYDGPEHKDTNPFNSMQDSATASANPFQCYITDNVDDNSDDEYEGPVQVNGPGVIEVSLSKDHVSVEDLLEFADQKPSAQQRGVESDEVRIMNKVLKLEVSPEECLEALEFSNWNVHNAIKVLRVKIASKNDKVTLEDCQRELDSNDGDILKAAKVLRDHKISE